MHLGLRGGICHILIQEQALVPRLALKHNYLVCFSTVGLFLQDTLSSPFLEASPGLRWPHPLTTSTLSLA